MVGIAREVIEACEFASYEGGEGTEVSSYYLTEKRSKQQQSDHSVTCRSCSISWNREGHGDSYRARKGSEETNENGNSVGHAREHWNKSDSRWSAQTVQKVQTVRVGRSAATEATKMH